MSKKKMRQPTKKELKEGMIAGKAFGGPRALTPGKKKGEMVYTRPSYGTEGTRGKRVQVKSGVKGGRGTPPPRVKPTPSKGQIHSAQMKEKLTKAVNEANNRSAKANRSTIRKNETIGQQRKRKAENEAIDKGFKTIALQSGSGISKAMDEDRTGPLQEDIGETIARGNRISKMEAEAAKAMKKKKKKTKPKKKPIVSRMTGGQIIAAIYD
tara:strand:- start:22 stop:654 length:633 start_codon:yes stop_codon:yes gene_type:complete